MNWDEVVKRIDAEIFNKTNRHLKEVEGIVLQGAWQGKTYEQMEADCQYSLSYLKQAAGPRLWKLLSQVLQESISKTNFRVVLERQWQISQQTIASSLQSSLTTNDDRQQDWGEAPETNPLYGRDRELKLLQQWIIGDRCRLMTIYGMGGIGKTTLATHFARQVQSQFENVIWRSLHYVTEAAELIDDLLQFFEFQPRGLEETIDSRISVLIDYLRQHRCLIVLDTATEIWQNGNLAGHYRKQYRDYGELLRRIGTEPHQSCLLLCTRDKPREIALLEGKASVRTFHLKGLTKSAKLIFQEKKLSNPEKWDELVALYSGNPLALKIVATTVQELFGGSVTAFLQQDTIVYGDISDLLDEQFDCLSTLEQEVINWLAIAVRPLSLIQLQSNILFPTATAELIDALESLIRRSVIIRIEAEATIAFSLHQPVVVQYAIERTVENISEEIVRAQQSRDFSEIEWLRNYALVTDEPEIRKRQLNRILIPLKNKLYRIFRDESAIESCLQEMLLSLANKTPLVVGYAPENLEALLQELRRDLKGFS